MPAKKTAWKWPSFLFSAAVIQLMAASIQGGLCANNSGLRLFVLPPFL
jgi:hypothetical protein